MPSKNAIAQLAGVPVRFLDELIQQGAVPKPRARVGIDWQPLAIGILQYLSARVDAEDPTGDRYEIEGDSFRAARIANIRMDTRLKQIKEAELLGQLAPVEIIQVVLTKVGREISGILKGVPGAIARSVPDVPPMAMELIKKELALASNRAADIKLADNDIQPEKHHEHHDIHPSPDTTNPDG